jgi:membrane protein implicated in regulation of membrane protease activity
MRPTSNQSEKKTVHSVFNLTLAAVVGQVGCLTLVILLAAIFGGLWLDGQFDTRPLFTIGLTLVSIPVTLVVMLWIVRTATSRLQSKSKEEKENLQEEANGGKYT